jgi:hypothetical protein
MSADDTPGGLQARAYMDLLWLALDSGPPIPALGLLIFLPIFLSTPSRNVPFSAK